MLQRLIGVTVGALVTFILLLLFYGGVGVNEAGQVVAKWNFVGDSTTAFLVASVLGAIASFFWPIVIGWWLVRRGKQRRSNQIESEVQRQLAEQQRPDR
jgi:hypothetical protein